MNQAQTIGLAARNAGNRIRNYAKLERVLAAVCLLTPLGLMTLDVGSTRDSISHYYDMTQNQVYYVPLTVVAMLFVVNGLVKRAHPYNTVLGFLLVGVLLFNRDDFNLIHKICTIGFFAGNFAVIPIFSSQRHRRIKIIAAVGVALAVGIPLKLDLISLFLAEWVSFAFIAAHFILESKGWTD